MFSTEMFTLAALSIPLALADLNDMTIGMVLDLIAEKSGEYERNAKQSDFDAF